MHTVLEKQIGSKRNWTIYQKWATIILQVALLIELDFIFQCQF